MPKRQIRVSLEKLEAIKTDEILIDGKQTGDIGDLVLKDREMLGENGIVIVSCTLDKITKKIIKIDTTTCKTNKKDNKDDNIVNKKKKDTINESDDDVIVTKKKSKKKNIKRKEKQMARRYDKGVSGSVQARNGYLHLVVGYKDPLTQKRKGKWKE